MLGGIVHNLEMKQLRQKHSVAEVLKAFNWQCQDVKPGRMAVKPMLFTITPASEFFSYLWIASVTEGFKMVSFWCEGKRKPGFEQGQLKGGSCTSEMSH